MVHGDRVLVVFEVGSFYEWYNCDRNAGCDVQVVCELLNIVKTRKDKRIPEVSRDNPEFVGVPNYAFPKFVPLLLEAGYTIALFKQHDRNRDECFCIVMFLTPRIFFEPQMKFEPV